MTPYIDGYDHGYLNGWQTGWDAAQTDLEARDEHLARRIVALLLQHEANGDLTAWVTTLKPYNERGIPRRMSA